MYICKSCGCQNEDDFKFCLECGANLEQQRAESAPPEPASMNTCPSCSGEISPGQRFCGHCGAPLAESAPESAPAPAAPAPAEEPATVISAAAAGQLVKVNPDGSAGPSVVLREGSNVLGRSSDDAVLSGDPFLSPEHADFHVQGDSVTITDLSSLNGVYYRIMQVTELQHGDYIRVGQEVLRFQLLDLAEPLVPTSGDGTVVAGSSPAGAWGSLERLSSPTQASFTFLLRGSEQVLGRERGDILFRDDGYVSGRHCRIFVDSGRHFIEDLKSSNGTFVRIRGTRTVTNETLVLMGEQPFRILLG